MSYHEADKPQWENGAGPRLSHVSLHRTCQKTQGKANWPAGLSTALGGNSILLHQRVHLLIKSLDQTLHLLDPFLHLPRSLSPTDSPLGTGIIHGRQTSVELPVPFM